MDDNGAAEIKTEQEPVERISNMEDAKVRFEKNMDAFSNTWPPLYHALKNHTPLSELVFLDNDEPDLIFRGISLYNEIGAYSYAREQIDRYWKSSNKLFTNRPSRAILDVHAGDAFEKCIERAKDCVEFNDQKDIRLHEKSYYLFLLGVGLGPHIEELLETTGASVLLILESNLDFLYHSLFICDWVKILKKTKDKELVIEFLDSSDTEEIAQCFGSVFRKYNPAAIDGTILYQHYSSAAYMNAYDLFIEKVFSTTLTGLGFFEDELVMIAQSYKNLSSGKSKTISHVKDPALSSMPAIIVGNGPSLDDHFEILKKIQDRVVIISCGTALDALLAEGIKPDFQIQMERDYSILQLYNFSAKHNDLSSICLIGSTTVFPGIADLFGDALYFFRPGLTPMPLFMTREDQKVVNSDPTVTNGGVASALHLGFKEIYFFGIDVGAKSPEHHHSKKSLYDIKDDSLPQYMDTEEDRTIPESFRHELPGNFGGKVFSSDILLWTKRAIEIAIRSRKTGRQFYNCSDGALIDGALPLLAYRMKIPETSLNKKAVLEDVMKQFPVYDKRTFGLKWKKADLSARVEGLADDLIGALDIFPELEDYRYSSVIMKLLKPNDSDDAAAMVYRGTVFMFQIAMHYFLNRAQTEEMAVKMREIYREGLVELILRIRDEALEHFRKVENDEICYDIDVLIAQAKENQG